MKIQSDFAILDVKRGRVSLKKKVAKEGAIEVVIYGSVVGTWGYDDGVSQEFEVVVDRVDVG